VRDPNVKRMTKTRTIVAAKTSVKKTAGKHVALAMHSASSPDWGTPMLLRSFSACVLSPAAFGPAIDLDYASSAYWQDWWPNPAERPSAFLDGSKGRDVLVEADRFAAIDRRWIPKNSSLRIGSGHLNAPGLDGGDMVQQCWALFEKDHRSGMLGSGNWVGFSVEQFGSLQNVAERNPLTTGVDDLITTIVPSRRAHYVVHPKALIAITKKKQARRDKQSKQWAAEKRLLQRLRKREDDRPVDAGAPSHLSYITILWHRERAVRRTQMEHARAFLKEQQQDPKSLLYKFEVIGPLEASR
jgi:hypothetical protein